MTTSEPPDMRVASITFGIFIGLVIFTIVKALRQTWGIWGRTKNAWNKYLWMMWIEVVVNLVFAITTYMYIDGMIQASFAYYLGVVIMWTIITQLLLQIVANRITLIMMDKRKARNLRWSLAAIVACVNISVFCIWIPGLMEVNKTWVTLNHIWERVEKSIFLLLDLGLNMYFLYLVRSRLISQGLTKYWALFNFNAAAILISTSMDILLLGLQSLPNAYAYIQFAPVAYIVKLNIELTMAEFISKIVRSRQKIDIKEYSTNLTTASETNASETQVDSETGMGSYKMQVDSYDLEAERYKGMRDIVVVGEEGGYKGEGIMKTVSLIKDVAV